jgi:UDP-3-O-[3-hydroxymyristoyl] glucosamine N-acyltransferase
MHFSAAQIALLINGQVNGDDSVMVHSFAKIEEAGAGQLSFLANLKYEEHLYTTKASLIIINANYELKQPVPATLIRVPDAYSAFAVLLNKYQEIMAGQLTGIQTPSFISPSASMGKNVFVGAFAYIGDNVVVGDNTKIHPQSYIGPDTVIGTQCIIHPGVKLYHDTVLGNHVTIHAGTVIGSDGFGFAPQADGSYKKVPQIGNVVIEDYVEIGANTTIDRATMGSTVIRKGAKLDNLIQVAHNVEVGSDTVIAAQAGVSGSTKIGRNVMIGGQAGIVGHITIADGSKINGQSGVTKSIVEPHQAVTGSPAFEYGLSLRSQAVTRKLPELEKKIKVLEALIKQLMAEKV